MHSFPSVTPSREVAYRTLKSRVLATRKLYDLSLKNLREFPCDGNRELTIHHLTSHLIVYREFILVCKPTQTVADDVYAHTATGMLESLDPTHLPPLTYPNELL